MNIPSSTEAGLACSPALRGGKYLAFALGREEYGLEIQKVREIIGMMDITPVPRMPPYIKGVINLRGKVISVIDLRIRLGLQPVERTDDTCIIVVDIPHGDRKLNTGMIVDQVAEVMEIKDADIEEPPTFGPAVSTDFVLGIGKVQDSLKILLDIHKLVRFDDTLSLASL
jgi:purine-binding chemotaxis protein CheW